MTKSTITRERIELIANFHRAMTLPPSHDEIEELARMALAAMDSKPVMLYRQVNPVNGMKMYWAELDPEEFRHLKQHTDENAEFMTLYRHAQPVLEIEREPVFTLEVARADYKGQKLGNHFGFITLDAARELKEGNYQLYTAQPAPVVPDEKPMPNPLSMYAVDAVAAIAEVKGWNACRAAMLQAGTLTNEGTSLQDNHSVDDTEKVNSPVIPDGLIAAVNRLLDSDGSRGCYSAIQCGDAHDEIERFLAAAPAGIPMIPDGYVMVPKEMTDEIGEAIAMQANCCGGIALDIYAAMLAAAPQLPGSEPAAMPGKWVPVSEQKPDCWCRTCRPVTLNDMRFVVCPDCGNKRCPRANDHRNACTGSNEPGQEGSAYPDTPREVK